jgi:DNA-binding SARP family transcriptional activator/tetratricopeptide (TPR) repeat protein
VSSTLSGWCPARPGRKGALPSGRFHFRLLGPFAVLREGTRVADRDVGSKKGRTLLKLLMIQRDHVVSIDRIAEVLWDEGPPPKWERDVATLVSRLRSVLGANAIEGGVTGYRFVRSERFTIDADQAERLAAESEARLAAGEPSLGQAAASRAMDILRAGPLLEEEPYAEWAEDARAAAAALLRRVRRRAWRAAMGLSHPQAAVGVAEEAIADDPLDEEAYRASMLARQRSGEGAQALAVYERLRSLLADQLGTDPGPETKALHTSILREEPIIDVVPSAPTRPAVDSAEPGFVGRDEEFARLSLCWSEAVAGTPSMVVIVGEAGIGKTMLAVEVLRLAERTGGSVAQARCYEAERSLFLQPLVDAIRPIVVSTPPDLVRDLSGEWGGTLADLIPEIGRILRPISYQRATPEIERRRAFEGVASFLRSLSSRQPVVLFLDDLQNAGSSTLEALHFLLRRAAGARLLVLATLRLGEGDDALAQIQDVARPMEIGPLSGTAVESLARRMGAPELAGEILRLTRGHPLFAVEVLRSLGEGTGHQEAMLPDSIVEAVQIRARRTGEAVEEMLRVAAVLGSSFDLATVADMLEVPVEEAARRAQHARRARLVVESGPAFEFANDLIKEILYRTTPLPVRVPRHRRAAALLAENPEAVAGHAAAAGEWRQAMEAGLQAAEMAAARFANRDAEELLDRAFEAALAAGDPVGEARVRLARGRARERLANYRGAVEDLSAAAQLAREAGERGLEIRALRHLGGDSTVALGHIGASVPYLESALAIARDVGDQEAEVDVLTRLGVVWSNRARFDLASEHAQQAVSLARQLGTDQALGIALDGVKTVAAFCGDLSTLQRVLPELERILRRTGQLWLLQWAEFESAFPAMAGGDFDRAMDRIEAAQALSRKTGYLGYQPWFVAHVGWIHRTRGQYGLALSVGREAVALADEVGHQWWLAFSEAMLGWTLTEVGMFDEAAAHLEQGLAAAERNGAESYLVRCLAHLALARWLSGDRTAAEVQLERAEAVLDGIGVPPGMAFLHGAHAAVAAGQVRLELGDPDRVEVLVRPIGEAAAAVGWKEVEADTALLLARCRHAAGVLDEARALAVRAGEVAAGSGLPRVGWESHAVLAGILADQGDAVGAEQSLASAGPLVEQLSNSLDRGMRRGYRKAVGDGQRRLGRAWSGPLRAARR